MILVALSVAGWILLRHSGEPRYQGKPVSYWFKRYYLSGLANDHTQWPADGAEALAKLGTNALPYLVRVALSTNGDSALRVNYYRLLRKMPESWHLPRFISQDLIRQESLTAIGWTGAPASVVLPLLHTELNPTNELIYGQALYSEATGKRKGNPRPVFRQGAALC